MKDKTRWQRYCRKLLECYKDIEVLSIPDLSESSKMPLKKLYVPLTFTPRYSYREEIIDEGKLFNYEHLVILGDPGSGKSTWVLHTIIDLAETFLEEGKGLIPIPIILRDYMEHNRDRDFGFHFCERLRTDLKLIDSPGEADLKELCMQRKALVLLDGMDEVGSKTARQAINDKINTFLKDFPGARFFCTSRIVGYDEAPLHGYPGEDLKKYYESDSKAKTLFTHVQIQPFKEKQIEQFVRKWYEIREWNPRERSERTETLLAAINANERIGKLAQNPLTLSMIAMVHRKLARLPDERAELYRVLTESLLEHWELQKYKNIIPGGNPLTTKLRRMEHLAEYMMGLSPGKDSGERAILISEQDVERIFQETILENEISYRGKTKEASLEAKNFLHYIKTRTGILMERGPGYYAFVHLSFQEYLTAAYLFRYYQNRWNEFLETYGSRLSDTAWQEALALFFEKAAHNDSASFNRLVAAVWMMNEPPLHLMAVILRTRLEVDEPNREHAVDILCEELLKDEYDYSNQVKSDWQELIEYTHNHKDFSAVGESCWQSFLAHKPKNTGESLHIWAGHFINTDSWVSDQGMIGEFFNAIWPDKQDHYLAAALGAVYPDLKSEHREIFGIYIEEHFAPNLNILDDESALVPLIFSGHCPDSALGPLLACVFFFNQISRDRDLSIAIDKTRALNITLNRDHDLSLALDRARARSLELSRSRAIELSRARALAQGLAQARALALARTIDISLDRAVIDFTILLENRERAEVGYRKRLASFWINLGSCYLLLKKDEQKKLDRELAEVLNHPAVKPNLEDPWERIGYTLYRLGRDPGDKEAQRDLQAIIEKPGDADLERLIAFLKLR